MPPAPHRLTNFTARTIRKGMVTRNPLVAFGQIATAAPAGAPPLGRFLGLDYGKARIGVAVSNAASRLALSHGVIAEKTFAARLAALADLPAKIGPLTGIVVGLPLNMDGSIGASGQAAQSFAAEVEKQLSLPVLLWDERLTSRQAEQAFFEQNDPGRHGSKFGKKASVGKIDAAAAVLMLQSFLDFWRVSLSARNLTICLDESGVITPASELN